MIKKMLTILTPENVHVEFELAGLGSRFAALCVDLLIQIALLAAIGISLLAGGVNFTGTGSINSIVIAVGIVLIFVIIFGYYIFFECLMNGQSPGKKLLKLRVIKQNGEPIGFFDSFIRNILRIIDFLPVLNLAGAGFILLSSNYQRIGDFAAGTILVKVQREEAPVTLEQLLHRMEESQEETEKVNLYSVNNFEYGILKEFLARQDRLGSRKAVFEFHLNNYFARKFNLEKPSNNPIQFFEEIVQLNARM